MNVLDLFSGIGGFSLGLERSGMRTVAFCEIEPYARAVLAKHWPGVHCYDDVRTLTADRLRADGIIPDVICGGFPCQDISLAGSGAGIEGARSGLWSEYARLIGELRPRFVIVENVAALLIRGIDRVLGDMATLGYDAQWHCIPASAIGAPHRRDRIWIVANPSGGRRGGQDRWQVQQPRRTEIVGAGEVVADTTLDGRIARRSGDAAQEPGGRQSDRGGIRSDGLADPDLSRLEILLTGKAWERATALGASAWRVEPDVGRVAYGIPARVDRLKGLGNAVVPQIPQIIGEAIMAMHRTF